MGPANCTGPVCLQEFLEFLLEEYMKTQMLFLSRIFKCLVQFWQLGREKFIGHYNLEG